MKNATSEDVERSPEEQERREEETGDGEILHEKILPEEVRLVLQYQVRDQEVAPVFRLYFLTRAIIGTPFDG